MVENLPGIYNVAADGVLALSEVIGLLGKPYAPILPPWGTGIAAGAAGPPRAEIPPEMQKQLRFGRGVDNRRYKAAGFHYGYTSRETVNALAEHLRLHPLQRGAAEPYRYEREVEEFLRWSPHVRSSSAPGRHRPHPRAARRAAPAAARRRARRRGAGRAGAPTAAQRQSPRPSPPARRSTTTTTSSPRRSSRCSARSSPATWRRCAVTRRSTRRARRCSARSTPFWPVCRQLLSPAEG